MKRIKVTAEDIKRGEPLQPSACPVAQALRRLGAREVLAGSWRAHYTINGHRRIVTFSRAMQRFVVAFDSGVRCKPITFLAPWSTK